MAGRLRDEVAIVNVASGAGRRASSGAAVKTWVDSHRVHRERAMVKCLFMIYRAPGMSVEQFSDYWLRVHSRLAIQAAPITGMRRYVQNHRRDHAVTAGFQDSRHCRLGDFDGVAEAWWDSFEQMEAAAGSTPAEFASAILEDEGRFIDLERSIIWFGEEKPFWPLGAS